MTTATLADAVRETAEDGSRHYIHPVTGERLTSVTTVLGATEGKPWLMPWSARLAAEFAVGHLAEVAQALKGQGWDDAVKLVKDQARLLRERKADAGSYVHDVAEALILWAASPEGTGSDIVLPDLPDHLIGADYDGEPLDQVVDWMVTGFLNFVATFKPRFMATEMTVFNRALMVAGTLDMIIVLWDVALTPDGTLIEAPGKALVLCVDIKTGRYLGATVQEQIATYRRMTEALPSLTEGLVPMPATDAGAILHLRPEHPDGYRLMPISPADDAKAWNRFRRAVEITLGRAQVGPKPGKVVRLRPDGTVAPPLLADLDGDGYPRILGPLMNAGLDTVADVALMAAADVRAVKGIGDKTLITVRRMLADHGLTFADETAPAGKVA